MALYLCEWDLNEIHCVPSIFFCISFLGNIGKQGPVHSMWSVKKKKSIWPVILTKSLSYFLIVTQGNFT